MSLCVVVFYCYAHKISVQHMTRTLLKWSLKQVSGTIWWILHLHGRCSCGNCHTVTHNAQWLPSRSQQALIRMRKRIIPGATPQVDF